MQRDELAVQRTDLAEDRMVLAAERTFASWLRTGLAFLASGLAAQRFLHDVLQSWQVRLLATVLVACAVTCFATGGWRDGQVRARLPQAGLPMLPRVLTLGISVLLVLVALPILVVIWLPWDRVNPP